MKWFGLLLLSVVVAAHADVETRTAQIFEIGKHDKPVFTQDIHVNKPAPGEALIQADTKDANGKLVMTETAEVKDFHLTHEYIEQLQIGEAYELKVDGKKATFYTYKLKDGKKGEPERSHEREIEDEDFITPPLTEPFLKKHWDELLAGKTLHVDLGAFEAQRIVGFKFTKIGEQGDIVEVLMKPSSFVISMLVSPIHLFLSKTSKHITGIRGRTALHHDVYGESKPLDADIRYEVTSDKAP